MAYYFYSGDAPGYEALYVYDGAYEPTAPASTDRVSGGWKRAGVKRKKVNPPVEFEEFKEPSKPVEVVAPEAKPPKAQKPSAKPPDELEEEALMRLQEFLSQAQSTVLESIRKEMEAQRKATADADAIRRTRDIERAAARAAEGQRRKAEAQAQREQEAAQKAIAKAAKEEEDAVAKLLMQRQKAARQAIAQAQKHLISLLNLKEPAL